MGVNDLASVVLFKALPGVDIGDVSMVVATLTSSVEVDRHFLKTPSNTIPFFNLLTNITFPEILIEERVAPEFIRDLRSNRSKDSIFRSSGVISGFIPIPGLEASFRLSLSID